MTQETTKAPQPAQAYRCEWCGRVIEPGKLIETLGKEGSADFGTFHSSCLKRRESALYDR